MLALLLGCLASDLSDARSAWLRDRLTEDNAVWLARDADLVATKYLRMAEDPYDFLRGTLRPFLEDVTRPIAERGPTRFLQVADASRILLVGDPHIENIGTCLPGEEPDPSEVDLEAPLTLEWVDLDAAQFGPWTLDTRRAALALALVGESVEDCDACATSVVGAFALAYADEIDTRASGGPVWDAGAEDQGEGAIVEDLRTRSRIDGLTQRSLQELAEEDDDERRIDLDDQLDGDGDGVLPLDLEGAAQLDRLLATWDRTRPPGFRKLDAARLYGKGVASLPAPRYLVLWDSGEASLEDDRLLNLREVVDPPSVEALLPGIGTVFEDNGDRVLLAAQLLWSRADADVRMDAVNDGQAPFKVTSTSGWFSPFDHDGVERLLELDLAEPVDLDAFAATIGRALASAHARGRTLDGTSPSLDTIRDDLARGGGSLAFVDERLRDAALDLAQLHVDHVLFKELLDDEGPLLGAEDISR